MKVIVLSVLLCFAFLCGCGRGGGEKQQQSDKDSSAKKPATAPGTVHIDADAQKLAGIQVVTVQPRSVPQSIMAAGQLVPNEERTAHVGTYVDGRVTAVFANVGDPVSRGEVLARMHSHQVHETVAAYSSALQDVARQRNALDFGKRTRDRMRRLYALKFASLQEVEKAETDVRSLETSLADAQISVTRETAHLSDILHLQPDQLQNIDETREQVPVISPIQGMVTARLITPGSVVEPGQEVYTVSDLGSVWMMAAVNEMDISKVKVGDRAMITSQAYSDRQFPARVTRLGAELDPNTRTLQVRLLVPNPGMQLRIAMFTTAHIFGGMSRSAIFIPEIAIQDINGGSFVFLRKQDGVFTAQPIQIARRVNGEAEVSAGLQAGDSLIAKGSFVAKSEMLKNQIGE